MRVKNGVKKSSGLLERKRTAIGILLLLPALTSLILFKYYPMILGIFISFFDLDIVNMPGEFVGFDNYIRAFTDVNFWVSVTHNIKIFVYWLAMNFWVVFVLAILINEVGRGKTFFRMAYFIPGCAPMIAMNILWKYFWQPDYGLANYLISLLGIPPQMWLNDPKLVYFCIHFPGLIICGGMNLVIYLAALQNIPQELYEAAVIDGAGVLQRIKTVTLPQIKSTIQIMLILAIISAMNAMENIMVLTGGGPAGETETVLLYAYKYGGNTQDYSYAITLSTIVFIIVMIMTIITTGKRKEG